MWVNTCGAPCMPWAPVGVSVGGCQKEPTLGSGRGRMIWERVPSLHAESKTI